LLEHKKVQGSAAPPAAEVGSGLDSAVSDELHSAGVQTEEYTFGKLKLVWIIGAWNLDIVCYLSFGGWNFL
jgi:hypothetical protein